MLKDYKNKTMGPIKGTFVINKVEYKTFSNKPGTFLSCEFTDLSGSMKGIMWDGFSSYKPWLKNKTVVEVSGELNTYKEATQIQIKNMNPVQNYDKALLVPSLPIQRLTEIETSLKSFKISIKNEICKIIWGEILGDPLGSLYMECPGGVGEVHHNYCGGLAEHSFSMIQIGEVLALQHTLDRDIILTGCLIHDIGKIQCYNWQLCLEMTDIGRLLHHTSVGYGMLLNIAEEKEISIDDPTFLKLAHIIIAHHEEEGIRKTMFAEANAVSHIDALDALVTHAIAYSTAPENKNENTNWTRFCSLTQKQYYIPIAQIAEPGPISQTPASKKPEPKKELDIIDDLFGDSK
jgi:3'-5' exoribonuclease